MHKLGITDASFLYMESPGNPMNIGSVQLLDVPKRDGFFDELKLHLKDRVAAVPFMCKRLKSTPLTLDQPVWVADPDFAIDNHVTRVVLGALDGAPIVLRDAAGAVRARGGRRCDLPLRSRRRSVRPHGSPCCARRLRSTMAWRLSRSASGSRCTAAHRRRGSAPSRQSASKRSCTCTGT